MVASFESDSICEMTPTFWLEFDPGINAGFFFVLTNADGTFPATSAGSRPI